MPERTCGVGLYVPPLCPLQIRGAREGTSPIQDAKLLVAGYYAPVTKEHRSPAQAHSETRGGYYWALASPPHRTSLEFRLILFLFVQNYELVGMYLDSCFAELGASLIKV